VSSHDAIYATLVDLEDLLRAVTDRDAEQEVLGPAVAALDAVIVEAKAFIGVGDPVVDRISDLISVESLAAGDPIRAIDALLVVVVLKNRVGPPPPEDWFA
jgi:hypothetical protein